MGFEKFNQYRKEKGLTNAQLADISGVPVSTVEKISAGQTTNPKLDTVKSLARALGCTLNDFDDTMQSNDKYTQHEQNLISKYQRLTAYGKKTIDTLIELELERLRNE